MKAVRTWMAEYGTDPAIVDLLMHRINAWHNDEPLDQFQATFRLRDLVKIQDEIGWESTFTGCWAIGWAEKQEQYFKSKSRMKTGQRWLAELIKKLWKVSWDMWEHRNNILFDEKQSLLRELQEQEIDHQFELGFTGFGRHMRLITSTTAEEVKRKNRNNRGLWIVQVQAARSRADEPRTVRERRLLDNQRRFMNRHFRVGMRDNSV